MSLFALDTDVFILNSDVHAEALPFIRRLLKAAEYETRDVNSVSSTDQQQHILQPHPKLNEIPGSDLITEVFKKNFSS